MHRERLPEVKFSLTDKTADARLQLIQGRVVAARRASMRSAISTNKQVRPIAASSC